MSHCQCCPNHVPGLSARAIKFGGFPHRPYDSGDFQRCLAVSWDPPEHMRGRTPQWSILVDHWVELRELCESTKTRMGFSPATTARIEELMQ